MMPSLPDIHGTIDRRLLLNFRVDPEVAQRMVPPPFRVNTTKGYAIAGICLIRLTELRPKGIPRQLGITSESAAIRVAVEWESAGKQGHGVYIPRRETSSRLTRLLGGRVFPGKHDRAAFEVDEADDRYEIRVRGEHEISVRGRLEHTLPAGSVFGDVDEASEFFRRDKLGYSPAREAGCYDTLEAQVAHWHVDPLEIDAVKSSYFDDPKRFPAGSITFDCALSMQRTAANWRWQQQLRKPAFAHAY